MERIYRLLVFAAIFLSVWAMSGQSISPARHESEHIAQGEGIVKEDAKLQVTNVQDGIVVDTGAMRFELRHECVLRALQIGDKALVAENDAPLLTASVLESEHYDGWRDYAPGKVIEAIYQPIKHDYTHNDKSFKASYTGRLDFGAGDSIGWELTLKRLDQIT